MVSTEQLAVRPQLFDVERAPTLDWFDDADVLVPEIPLVD